MARLLHISASPRGERSESLALAGTFLEVYRELNPADEVDEWDLWDGGLPEFGPAAAAAKMDVFAGKEPAGRAPRRGAGPGPPSNGSRRPTSTCSRLRCGTPGCRTS